MTTTENNTKLSEAKLWQLVNKAQWEGRHDLDFAQSVYTKLPFNHFQQLWKFVEAKLDELDDKFGKKITNVGDDSWWDLRAEVVGRGKSFYHKINMNIIQSMADDVDYVENYQYSFQKHKDFDKVNIINQNK